MEQNEQKEQILSTEPTTFTKVKEHLNNFTDKVGLGRLSHNSEVINYLNLSKDEIKRMSPGECLEVAFLLIREALYLQQLINHNNAKNFWLTSRIDMDISSTISQYDKFIPHLQKKLMAISQSDTLQQYHKTIIGNQLQNESLAYLPSYLKDLANVLIETNKIKRSQT